MRNTKTLIKNFITFSISDGTISVNQVHCDAMVAWHILGDIAEDLSPDERKVLYAAMDILYDNVYIKKTLHDKEQMLKY